MCLGVFGYQLCGQIARADVFVQNLAPGASDRLGTAPARLRAQYPRLIVCNVSGYGASGPYAQKKAYVRVLRIPHGDGLNNFDSKRVGSGLLLQSSDNRGMTRDELKVVSKLAPTDKQFTDLLFAWKVAKFVKSNAIVYAKDNRTIGVGAGQMSRVYSARIAGIKAADANLVVEGSVMASDAFFPFRDGVDVLAQSGAVAVVQPGGSVRDDEVIGAANEHGLAMVFTGMRHFRH